MVGFWEVHCFDRFPWTPLPYSENPCSRACRHADGLPAAGWFATRPGGRPVSRDHADRLAEAGAVRPHPAVRPLAAGDAGKLVLAERRRSASRTRLCDEQILEVMDERLEQVSRRRATFEDQLDALRDCLDVLPNPTAKRCDCDITRNRAARHRQPAGDYGGKSENEVAVRPRPTAGLSAPQAGR